jgi:hypothetical protein
MHLVILAAGAFIVLILVHSYAYQWVRFSVHTCAVLPACGGAALLVLASSARLQRCCLLPGDQQCLRTGGSG